MMLRSKALGQEPGDVGDGSFDVNRSAAVEMHARRLRVARFKPKHMIRIDDRDVTVVKFQALEVHSLVPGPD